MAESTNNTDRSTTGRGNSFLYFVVGGLVALVAIGFFVIQGGSIGPAKTPTEQSAPAASGPTTTAPATTPPASSTSN